jgi:hypothetical protein
MLTTRKHIHADRGSYRNEMIYMKSTVEGNSRLSRAHDAQELADAHLTQVSSEKKKRNDASREWIRTTVNDPKNQ